MARRKKRTPEYKAWEGIKDRCFNPNHRGWDDYGGRGITLYEGWRHNFPAFLEHVGLRPGIGYSIDRIDNDKGYEPGNLRWATTIEQRLNQRPRKKGRVVQVDGIWMNLSDAAKAAGISYQAFWARLNRRGEVYHRHTIRPEHQ